MTAKKRRIIPIHSRDEIPTFTTEDEERAFWQTHEMTPELWHSLPPVAPDIQCALHALQNKDEEQDNGRTPPMVKTG